MESEETSLADDHADGSIESAEDTGSGVLTSDKKEYGMIFWICSSWCSGRRSGRKRH